MRVMSQPTQRISNALADAAYAAHPMMFDDFNGGNRWTGPQPSPDESELIDWFQMTHPTEARWIEAEIEQLIAKRE